MGLDPNLLNSESKDVVLALGIMWGKSPGSDVYDIPFGALQKFSLDTKHTLKELRDPLFRTAGAVGSVASEVTIKSEEAQIRGRNFLMTLGGSLTYDGGSGTTTHAITSKNIRPTAFAIQIFSRDDPNAEIIGVLPKCIADQDTLTMDPENYVLHAPQFKCYGDADNGDALITLTYQGDHTSDGSAAPLAPTSPSATPGATSSAEIALAWTASSGATEYEILRSTSSGSGYVIIGTTSGVKFLDYNATTDTHYYYVIRAANGNGVSGFSTQVDAVGP